MSASGTSDNGDVSAYHVGDKVSARWREKGPHEGEWYNATVVSVSAIDRTAHVLFDDGDEDDDVPWEDMSVRT